MTNLITTSGGLPSVRGIVCTQVRRGAPLELEDLQRWIEHLRIAHGALKVDVHDSAGSFSRFAELLEWAGRVGMPISLRTECESPPPNLGALHEGGLADVLLVPRRTRGGWFQRWLKAVADAQLPLRIQMPIPFDIEGEPKSVIQQWSQSGLRALVLRADDPLAKPLPSRSREQSLHALRRAEELASACAEIEVDVSVTGIPYCALGPSVWPRIVNRSQECCDHQGYIPTSIELAAKLHATSPRFAARAIKILLSRDTLHHHPADNLLLPWILDRRLAHLAAGVARRVMTGRPGRFLGRRTLPVSKTLYERERIERRDPVLSHRECLACSLRRICCGPTPEFREALSGIEPRNVPGDPVVDPVHFIDGTAQYYDAIDSARLNSRSNSTKLESEATSILRGTPPTRILEPKDYGVEKTYFERFEGGLKWFAVTDGERVSTPLARLSPPCLISFDAGGGLAHTIGFRLGRGTRIVCPMIAYRHSVALYIDANGSYLLLRDGVAISSSLLQRSNALPARLPDVVEPCMSISDIEDTITTYNVRLWELISAPERKPPRPAYSVIVVSTRFSRRLQAVLRSIAHQSDLDPRQIEVLVCYVPGVDATDDLLDSVAHVYPDLRVVRVPFAERHVHSKGFMINEAGKSALGDWIMLLDSDTLLPPDFFQKLAKAPKSATFIAPDGRKMLSPDVTARVLLGEIVPWKEWTALLDGPGSYRRREAKGVPVGFCQVFKARFLREIPYLELEHFEWSDMAFGKELLKRAGKEHRLSGTIVLHLDHGSSQWFGTRKQY